MVTRFALPLSFKHHVITSMIHPSILADQDQCCGYKSELCYHDHHHRTGNITKTDPRSVNRDQSSRFKFKRESAMFSGFDNFARETKFIKRFASASHDARLMMR